MADELLLSIEKLLYKGDGLAHAEGNTVFVPFVSPGEQVRASIGTRKKNLIHAKLEEVKQASTAGSSQGAHILACAAGATTSTLSLQNKFARRKKS